MRGLLTVTTEVYNFVSSNDISGNDISKVIGLEGFEKLSFAERITSLGRSFIQGLSIFFHTLKDGLVAIKSANQSVRHFGDIVYNLTYDNTVEGINLNDYIAGVRWCTGEIVFVEIYTVLMICLLMMVFNIFTKLIKLIKYIFQTIWGNAALIDITNQPLLGWIIKLFRI